MADEFDLDAALAEIEDMTPAAEPERKAEPAPKAEAPKKAPAPRAAMERAARPVVRAAEPVAEVAPSEDEPEPIDTDIGDAPPRLPAIQPGLADRGLAAASTVGGAIYDWATDSGYQPATPEEQAAVDLAMTRHAQDRARRHASPAAFQLRAYGRKAGDLGTALVEQMKADPRLAGVPTRADVDRAAMERAARPAVAAAPPSPGFNMTEEFEVGEEPRREPTPAQSARRALVKAGMPVDEAKALLDNEAIEAAKEL